MSSLSARADQLLRAHHAEMPLVLPNAWDVSSAKLVEAAGYPVVATSSRAVAMSLGLSDDDSSDPGVVFAHLARIARAVGGPVTADLEAGHRLSPSQLVEAMLAAGVVGCNLEDSDHHGHGVLVDVETQAAFLAAVRSAAAAENVHVVINARTDGFIRKVGDDEAQLADAIRRARRYLEAGADCVYPIALADRDRIARFVEAVPGPVNIQARRDGLDLPELASLGVRRVSLASGLFGLVTEQTEAALRRLSSGGLTGLWHAPQPPAIAPRTM